MRERVFGIETEYALIYHPAPGEADRPTNLDLYRRFERALATRVRSLPCGFSPLRAKGGRFLENGGTFHYEASADSYDQGLLELASPECRDPFTLLCHERAKDELVEELAEQVNAELELTGWRGRVRMGKNNVDSVGHTFGSHESYWVDDPLSWGELALLLPVWLALWLVSAPVVGFVIGSQVVLLALLVLGGLGALFCGALLRLFWPAGSLAIFRGMERFSNWLETHPSELTRRLHWLAAPIYPLMSLHSAVYNRFHFKRLRDDLTAHLVTRTLYAGAGALVLDGGPLMRLAQRPPFLRALARIFPDGEERPLYETRDLFFAPWTALSRRRRLHLLVGDANLAEPAQLLRVGATALVLEAIEARSDFAWPRLAHPLEALQELNADPELRTELALADGSRASALALQRRYLRGVRRVLDPDGLGFGDWRDTVVRDWQRTLDLLESDPDALADRIDWIAKRTLIRADVPDPADREAIARDGARLVASDALPDPEERRLRELAFRAWRTDLRYHELGPRGGFRRLEQRGRMRRLSDPERVERARTRPPDDTRAHARGQAIRWAHAQAVPGHAAWHRVRLGKLGWRFFRDPLDPQRWRD